MAPWHDSKKGKKNNKQTRKKIAKVKRKPTRTEKFSASNGQETIKLTIEEIIAEKRDPENNINKRCKKQTIRGFHANAIKTRLKQ